MKIPAVFYYFIAIAFILLPAIFIYETSEPGKGIDELSSAKGIPTFIGFICVVIIFVIYSKLKYRKSKVVWETGVFNDKQAYNEDTLLQAYIRLGGLMLRKDTDDLKGKMMYLHRYFDRHFENTFSNELTTALNKSFHHPVKLNTITPWLKRNLRSNSQRSQLIYFLAGLSAVDGSINPREMHYLKELSHLLDISKKDVDSILAMYSKYEDAFNNQHKQRRQTPSKSKELYKREKAANILGISINASSDEIKKAYRNLAKIHHPDRFASESQSQQKIAKERFVKIQLAYELLFELKN